VCISIWVPGNLSATRLLHNYITDFILWLICDFPVVIILSLNFSIFSQFSSVYFIFLMVNIIFVLLNGNALRARFNHNINSLPKRLVKDALRNWWNRQTDTQTLLIIISAGICFTGINSNTRATKMFWTVYIRIIVAKYHWVKREILFVSLRQRAIDSD